VERLVETEDLIAAGSSQQGDREGCRDHRGHPGRRCSHGVPAAIASASARAKPRG
jgi:hypothetical protein